MYVDMFYILAFKFCILNFLYIYIYISVCKIFNPSLSIVHIKTLKQMIIKYTHTNTHTHTHTHIYIYIYIYTILPKVLAPLLMKGLSNVHEYKS